MADLELLTLNKYKMNLEAENLNEPQDQPLLIADVSSSLSFEDYMKEQIEEGYISENGTPLKCWCGCTDFKQVKQYYCEHGIEEYSLQCTNKDCLKIVGHWAFGNWQV